MALLTLSASGISLFKRNWVYRCVDYGIAAKELEFRNQIDNANNPFAATISAKLFMKSPWTRQTGIEPKPNPFPFHPQGVLLCTNLLNSSEVDFYIICPMLIEV
jgi:hypothetical protein